jgi:4'-phosphopantetheinyl transferase
VQSEPALPPCGAGARPAVKTLVMSGRPSNVLAQFEDPREALTRTERDRADALSRPADREAFVAAHLLVRLCAASVLRTDPSALSVLQWCDSCESHHGAPSITEAPELAVGWSHTKGGVAAAAGCGPLGVDIERLAPRSSTVLPRRMLTPLERLWLSESTDVDTAFLQLWTRKESLIKIGRLSLGTMARANLIGDAGELVETWEDLRFTDWSLDGLIGACAHSSQCTDTHIKHL